MPAFLTCALILCAYLMSIQALASSRYVRVSLSRLSALLLPVALIILAAISLCALSLGSWDDMLMLLTVALPFAAAVSGIFFLRRCRDDLHPVMTVLFLVSLLAVGFVTLFSRDGSSSTKVLFGLYKMKKAIQTGSVLPLTHILQNILLFIPFGFLICACCPDKKHHLFTALTYALLLSCTIESLQYLLVIGECDLEDVLSNVLGAWAGLGIYKLYLRTQ